MNGTEYAWKFMSSLFYANEIAFACRWHEKVIECARPDRLFSIQQEKKHTHKSTRFQWKMAGLNEQRLSTKS